MKKLKPPTKYVIGQTYENNKGESFVIIDYPPERRYESGRSKPTRIVRFLATGSEREVTTDAIRNKKAKDLFSPSVFGVGYLGNSKKGVAKTPLYERWLGMLGSCYSPKSTRFKNYGAQGFVVAKEWHNFSTFAKDFSEKENYENLVQSSSEYGLQIKDSKISKKVFSNETVVINRIGTSGCSPVYQYNLEGKLVGVFENLQEAIDFAGVSVRYYVNEAPEKYSRFTLKGYIYDYNYPLPERKHPKMKPPRFTGVYFHAKNKRWIAQIFIDKQMIHLGSFKTEEEALKARREAECKFWK
jgi:hypothetical protein